MTFVAPEEDLGNIEAVYRFKVVPEADNLIVVRLYTRRWFLNRPLMLEVIIDNWKTNLALPKAALLTGESGDIRIAIEWAVCCHDVPLPQHLLNKWFDEFRDQCVHFLYRYADVLRPPPRFDPDSSGPTTQCRRRNRVFVSSAVRCSAQTTRGLFDRAPKGVQTYRVRFRLDW